MESEKEKVGQQSRGAPALRDQWKKEELVKEIERLKEKQEWRVLETKARNNTKERMVHSIK